MMIVFRWASLFQLVPTGRSLSIGKFTLAAITARKKSKESGTVSGWLACQCHSGRETRAERRGEEQAEERQPQSGSRRDRDREEQAAFIVD